MCAKLSVFISPQYLSVGRLLSITWLKRVHIVLYSSNFFRFRCTLKCIFESDEFMQ